MIFLDPAIDGSDDLYTLGNYSPVNDPQFKQDDFSKRLLAIKYRHDSDPDPQPWKQRKKTQALRQLFHLLKFLHPFSELINLLIGTWTFRLVAS